MVFVRECNNLLDIDIKVRTIIGAEEQYGRLKITRNF